MWGQPKKLQIIPAPEESNSKSSHAEGTQTAESTGNEPWVSGLGAHTERRPQAHWKQQQVVQRPELNSNSRIRM